AHAPTVSGLYPNGGEILSGSSVIFHWTSTDADNDHLSYLVQYSRDGGNNWQMLAADLTTSNLSIDLSTVAGSTTALIRVIASDGFLSTEARSSAVFTVSKHDPQAQVLTPSTASAFFGNQTILFTGFGSDAED